MNTANKNGILFGLLCPGELRAKKEPVAYLYNGVRLPKLPEWDKEKYPYAFIKSGTNLVDTYYLVCFGECPTTFESLGAYWTGVPNETAYVMASTTTNPSYSNYGTWNVRDERTGTVEAKLSRDYGNSVVWANYDVLNMDGSVFLAATDPVPVYDEESPFPEGMTGITWDGNTDGLYRSGTSIPYYLVSDKPLPVEAGMDCVLELVKDGVRTIVNTKFENANVSGCYKVGDYVRIYTKATTNYEYVGTYLRNDDSGFVAMVAYPNKE